MNNFPSQIRRLEKGNNTYEIKIGSTPAIITSAHGIGQKKRNDGFKLAEPFTRTIAKYVSRRTNCSYLVKNEDTGVDPNKKNGDELKTTATNLVVRNHIKLLIDIHGAKESTILMSKLARAMGKW